MLSNLLKRRLFVIKDCGVIATFSLIQSVVAGSKYIDKQTKDNKELVISNLKLVKNYHNPYINSLKTVSLLLEDKGMVLLDDKYLYYQV